MKATGIVRRIDDLGRVVIPKEVRRTLRIREGDPMEVYIGDGGEIIFRKYSPVASLNQFAGDYAQSLHKVSGYAVLVCDRGKVIEAVGIPKKNIVGQPVSQELIESGMGHNSQGVPLQKTQRFAPVEGQEYQAMVSAPILVDSDVDGFIVMLAKDEDSVAGESEIKLIQTAAVFISSLLSGY